MEKGFSFRKKNVPPTQKEVFKDLSAEIKGRDSPESGSLYSDYESGQQYEDKVNITLIRDCCQLILQLCNQRGFSQIAYLQIGLLIFY